jgi:hypothetical protein
MTSHDGSAVRYRNRGADGCRCDACREAHRQYVAARKQEWRNRPDLPHGTESGYHNWGCRCDACRAAYRAKNARSAAVRKLRQGKPLSPWQAQALAAGPPDPSVWHSRGGARPQTVAS